VRLRDATPQDWPAIHAFFSTIVAAGETYAYPPDQSSEDARALWMSAPPDRVVVAVDGDTVLGSARMGPNRPGRGAHVATASFMVDPRHAGRGVGRALATQVLDRARAEGYRSMQFNAVVETNRAAVHLWQDLGFRILTTVPEAFDSRAHGLVGLHVMFQELTGDGGAGAPR